MKLLKIKNLLLLLFLLNINLYSSNIEKYISFYDVNVEYIGKVAEATINYENVNNKYVITMNIKPYGKLKSFLFNKQITYISNGYINKNGYLIPERYTTIEINDKYILKKYSYFEHKNKKLFVEMKMRKKIITTNFNWKTLSFDESIDFEDKVANYYDENYYEYDFLSFIFNVKKLNFNNNKIELRAYGLKDNHQGKISISKPNKNQIKKANDIIDDKLNNLYYVSVLKNISDNSDIEQKDRFIYLNFDKDNILKDMISEDAFNFGDAVLIRKEIYYKVKK